MGKLVAGETERGTEEKAIQRQSTTDKRNDVDPHGSTLVAGNTRVI